ncbi:histone deacetylase clr3 [Uncinocarpus reesii 1704]|uniref:histone deacetylase n=1 Tax=Uncinocarpus reesii (strain UAMH 1704) TaxID=336963 RepID=C4JME1_UNCRE|nr:histone deacetylase clr3 [Uncinocarpus reesii 1704]EEP79153.1 histone deacetylase clr3 [Uncinocarpus reesii 1704]
MDADEDVVMSGTGTTVPVRTDKPSSASPNKIGTEKLNGASRSSGQAESLLAAFQRKVVAPGNLIKEIEDHQAGTHSSAKPKDTKQGSEKEYESVSEEEEESDSSVESDEVPTLLPISSLPTGVCYDIRMRYHCEVKPTLDVHPEDPRRIYYIYKELCKAGLVDDPDASRPLVSQPLLRIPARNATLEEISLIHDPEHYDFVRSTKTCGGAIETCKAVVSSKVKNAIAVIRPPGHHAEQCQAMGFCLFNNVCVAARVCQNTFGDKCRKIMIVDCLGNGVQNAFYDDPNVLYVSIHVYKDGAFYPGGEQGNWDQCGEGVGLGKNVNIPWPTQGMGDGDYLYAFQEVIMPIGYEFNPDLVISEFLQSCARSLPDFDEILVSAGFDAAAGDELGGCFVTPPCYAHMTSMLMNLANGKVAVCLEGGYNFRSISKSALAVTRTLMGEPPDRLIGAGASNAGVSTVRQVAMIQSKYWRCMYPKGIQIQSELSSVYSLKFNLGPPEAFWGNRVHDIIRQYQAKQLYDEHKLTSLYIYRNSISKSFENQVLARPELMGIPHPLTNTLEAHNCWMADVVKDYIGWAMDKNIGVIDVNIPKHFTKSSSFDQYEDEDKKRIDMAEELAVYLWENYIEYENMLLAIFWTLLITIFSFSFRRPNEATHVFFMGVGNAFGGLSRLLSNKGMGALGSPDRSTLMIA